MTTIAYRNGVLAADTSQDAGGAMFGKCVKIVRNERGDLAGASGDAVYGAAFRRWFMDGEKGPAPNAANGDKTKGRGLIIRLDGTMISYEMDGFFNFTSEYCAIGSGTSEALGAMFMGATAVEAVKAAIAHDTYTAGEITVLRHLKKARQP